MPDYPAGRHDIIQPERPVAKEEQTQLQQTRRQEQQQYQKQQTGQQQPHLLQKELQKQRPAGEQQKPELNDGYHRHFRKQFRQQGRIHPAGYTPFNSTNGNACRFFLSI